MEKNYSTLRGMMASAAAVFAYIILALTLCTIVGYAAETGNGSTANKPLELPIRENPVAAGYSDYYVILENGTLIQSFADKVKGLTGTGFTFNQTVELMDNVAAVYAASETGGGSDIVLVVDRDGTLWARCLPDWGIELTIGKEVSAEGWFKLEENVAMASVDKFHAVILKRNGSLWVAGRDEYGCFRTTDIAQVFFVCAIYHLGGKTMNPTKRLLVSFFGISPQTKTKQCKRPPDLRLGAFLCLGLPLLLRVW